MFWNDREGSGEKFNNPLQLPEDIHTVLKTYSIVVDCNASLCRAKEDDIENTWALPIYILYGMHRIR